MRLFKESSKGYKFYITTCGKVVTVKIIEPRVKITKGVARRYYRVRINNKRISLSSKTILNFDFANTEYFYNDKKNELIKVHILKPVGTRYKQFAIDHKIYTVHRAVATLYIDNTRNYDYVNHKNGVKYDSYVGNLEWCTARENRQHALNTGLATGVKNNCGKKIQVLDAINGKFIERFNSIKEAERTGRYTANGIHLQMRGKQKTHRGCIFKKESD